MKMQDKSLQKKSKAGPKPDHLKIDGVNWESAVGKALQKKRPTQGWPKAIKKKKK